MEEVFYKNFEQNIQTRELLFIFGMKESKIWKSASHYISFIRCLGRDRSRITGSFTILLEINIALL